MNIQEKFIYEIWKEKKFSGELTLDDSEKIQIIDVGLQNRDLAGPDFLNARIKIGNITYLGDVEIDTWHSDWKAHGHYFDKKYNKVMLHIVASNEKLQPFVYTQDGRKVHSLCITDFLDKSLRSMVIKAVHDEKANRKFHMPCYGRNSDVPVKEKLNFVCELGVERFKNKSRKILERIKQMLYLKEMNIREPVVRYDFGEDFMNKKYSADDFSDPIIWQQVLYEMIFEALGYSKNKDIMNKLAKAVNIPFVKTFTDQNLLINIESELINVSGLMPSKTSFNDEDTTEYIRMIVEAWNNIKQQYDGPTFRKEKWNFFKLRPNNFPTIRIAGGARLLERLISQNLFENIINIFSHEETIKEATAELRNLIIVRGNGFWTKHFTFEKTSREVLNYFIGISRADEIITNVILPVLYLYFEIFSDADSSRRVQNLYVNYIQKSSNMLVDDVADTLHLKVASQRTICHQGLIELFRNYCVKERCLECKIGEKIFN